MRRRVLDSAVRLLAAAGPTDLLAFIGPKRAAAAAGASVGGLYHHWPDGGPAFAADVVRHAREASSEALAQGVAGAAGFDDLAARLVLAVRAAPGAVGLGLIAPEAAAVGPAVGRLLEQAGRTPRPTWTTERIATLLAGLAVGIVAVEPDPDALVADAVRLVLLATCAGAGDLRGFDAALAALDSTSPLAPRQDAWSMGERIPSVRLGLGGGSSAPTTQAPEP